MSDLGRSPASYRGLAAHSRQHASSSPNRDLQKAGVPLRSPDHPAARSAETSCQLSPGVTRSQSSRQNPEMGEGVGFAVAVAELAEDGERAALAVGGLVQVAEHVLGIARAAPCACLVVPVAQFLVQGNGLLAECLGLRVVAGPGTAAAQIVHSKCLPGPVTSGVVQGERPVGMRQRVQVAALRPAYPGKGRVQPGLAGAVTKLPTRNSRCPQFSGVGGADPGVESLRHARRHQRPQRLGRARCGRWRWSRRVRDRGSGRVGTGFGQADCGPESLDAAPPECVIGGDLRLVLAGAEDVAASRPA